MWSILKRVGRAVIKFFTPAPLPAVFEGRAVHVADGDTLEVTYGWQRCRIRLAGIDAPELAQDYGLQAQELLASLTFRRTVRVELRGIDRYGRRVARVTVGSKDVAQALLNAGLAWHLYGKSQLRVPEHTRRYARTAQKAKAARRGLWAGAHLHPAQWRVQNMVR